VLCDIVCVLTDVFLLQNYVMLWCTHKGSNIFGHNKSTAFPVPIYKTLKCWAELYADLLHQYLSNLDNECGRHQIEIHLQNITEVKSDFHCTDYLKHTTTLTLYGDLY
jgi:hypothetical protein